MGCKEERQGRIAIVEIGEVAHLCFSFLLGT
jgi:hypothetical protein